jgi:non-specific serine/threonine protein kinase
MGPAMPRKALEPGVAAFGQDVVVAGGFDTGASEGLDITARVDAFDTTTGTWSSLPDAPVRWIDSNLATVGATLYLLGGLDGTQRTAHGEAYALDPVSHAWQAIAAMDAAGARGAAGVVVAPGHIYLLGGAASTGPLASCLDYDIATGRWSPLGPDLPEPRAHPAAMRRSDGTLIVAGGFASLDSSEPRGQVWALPPPGAVPRDWQVVPAMHPPAVPAARGGCAYGVVLGQLVCAGGEAGPSAQDAVESYDPYNDLWMMGEQMPVARAGVQGAAIGGRLYVPGGAATLGLEPTDTLYVYSPLDTAPR